MLWDQADEEGIGKLTVGKVTRLTDKTVLGHALSSPDELDNFISLFVRVDRDRDCCLDFTEFVWLFRTWGNAHADTIKDGMLLGVGGKAKKEDKKRPALNRQNTVGRRVSIAGDLEGDVKGRKLVQNTMAQALAESVEDAVLAWQWKVPVAEVRLLRETFEFSDADGSGLIEADEIQTLLKNVGCPPHTGAQRAALASCRERPEFSGDLAFHQTLGMLDMYYSSLASEVVRWTQSDDEQILVKELVPALYQAGLYLRKDAAAALLGEARAELGKEGRGTDDTSRVDEDTLSRMLGIQRKRQQENWRRTFGFDDSFVKRVRNVCAAKGSLEGIDLDDFTDVL